MNCCVECFCDNEIRTIIESYKRIGNCGFCSAKDVFVYDIADAPNPISDMIISVLDTYVTSNHSDAKPLKNSLSEDWDIFNVGVETIQSLVTMLCNGGVEYYEKGLFTKNVSIVTPNTYCIVNGHNWEEFSNSIKVFNRFHNAMFNSEAFGYILNTEIVKKTYAIKSRFFRARIATDKGGFPIAEMGAPPKGKRTSGRINPEGIVVLYLSSDNETVLNEVRASAFDYVSIGTFELTRDIKIATLSAISSTSPFRYDDIERYIANRKVFKEISSELAKPLRRNDSLLEYLPTQYIAEFIKSQGYDGVEYTSTLKEGGFNIALFDEKLAICRAVETIEVSKIWYETKP